MINTMRPAQIAAALATISFIPWDAQSVAWCQVACLTERSPPLGLGVCALFVSVLDCLPKANRTSLP